MTMIRNPLEQFMINELTSLRWMTVGGWGTISITNIGIYLIMTLVIIVIVSQIMVGGPSIIGYSSTILIKQSLYDTVHKIVKDQIGRDNERNMPLIYTLFMLILTINIIGMIPYNYSITSHLKTGWARKQNTGKKRIGPEGKRWTSTIQRNP